MPLHVHDTQRREKVPFSTRRPGRVGMYVCGVTVQSRIHIGHAYSYVAFDVVRRWLEASGYDVTHIQNHTDIDDKIIAKANEAGITWKEHADQMIKLYHTDMDHLNVLRAHVFPRATEHIPQMFEMIGDLLEQGHAYVAADGVWFSVDSASEKYGRLTGNDSNAVQEGASGRLEESGKRDHKDFVLWKAARPGEPSWDSPWMPGRPGWHIECSAMARQYLGDQFDLHGGGVDLKFPHHEAEILQTECVTHAEPSVGHWLHNGHLTVAGEKMGKSLDNFWLIADVLEQMPALALRHAMLNGHYRQQIEISQQMLDEAQLHQGRLEAAYAAALDAWGKAKLDTLARLPEGDASSNVPLSRMVGLLEGMAIAFARALDDDFNTRDALSRIHAAAREISRSLDTDLNDEDRRSFGHHATEWLEETAGRVLGLLPTRTQMAERKAAAEQATARKDARKAELAPKVEPLLEQRSAARAARDWAAADSIRDQLNELGVTVTDTTDGPSWDIRSSSNVQCRSIRR